jgi:PAS domain S-box-containing protein
MKKKILVIDDEEGIRFTFKKFLSDRHYDVYTAKDFEEAQACLNESDFDLIFADIILKGKNGIDILREIRKKNIYCPVVIITGYPSISTASESIRLGAFDYIPKPITKEALLHVTESALRYKEVVDEKEQYRSNLEAIFRSVNDAIITVDPNMSILEVNRKAEKICGITRASIGKPFQELKITCNEGCVSYLADAINKKQSLEAYRIECHSTKNPQQVATLSISPLLNKQGKFSGAIMVVRDETRLTDLERQLKERQEFYKIVGKSKKMQEIYSLIELLADYETTVLITGESGTGKELVAEALHYLGNRRKKPIVKVNCSALSENLLESELFGHVKGAFTGAIRNKVGRFQTADGGTIFLDEIADVSKKIQVKLLRVLQEKSFERVGDSTPIKVDVRVVAATNQDLYKKVKLGEFRKDLFYRLNVMKITLPSLTERREDIPLLTEHFLQKFNSKFNKNIKGISDDVQKLFMNYHWPGNVRELEHAIEHAFILCNESVIRLEHLPPETRETSEVVFERINRTKSDEYNNILQALEKTGWNKTKAARILGISRRTLYRKIKEHSIPDNEEEND